MSFMIDEDTYSVLSHAHPVGGLDQEESYPTTWQLETRCFLLPDVDVDFQVSFLPQKEIGRCSPGCIKAWIWGR